MTSKQIAAKYGCGDGGCVMGHPGGMHTNGGCNCLTDLRPAERVKVRMGIMELRKALKEYEALLEVED